MRYLRTPRRAAAVLAALAAAVTVTVTAAGAAGAAQASGPAAGPPPCSLKPPPHGKLKPTTVTTIGQAYSCIFDHYYAAATLDDQVLLAAAFAGLTQELDRLGLDQPDATMPALTGNRDTDWARFAAVYQQITGKLPAGARQQAAAATMNAMVAALGNNHTIWQRLEPPPGGSSHDNAYGLGILTTPSTNVGASEALPPLYVSGVNPGSPAAKAGVRPGDVITKVNGSAPFTDGTANPGVFSLLRQQPPQQQTVRITLRWPVTGATRTVTLTPAAWHLNNPGWSAKLLAGHIAYVQLDQLVPSLENQALAAISAMEKKAKLRGVILDLRTDAGGAPAGVAELTGALEHGRAYGYDCTGTGKCTATYPNSKTPLLNLPLTVLTSRTCASACDSFTSAVKDLHLGTLIGTRTAGVAGAATVSVDLLNDGSDVQLTTETLLGADHEIFNGIGTAADYYIPVTARDVATGHDPDIAKARTVLGA